MNEKEDMLSSLHLGMLEQVPRELNLNTFSPTFCPTYGTGFLKIGKGVQNFRKTFIMKIKKFSFIFKIVKNKKIQDGHLYLFTRIARRYSLFLHYSLRK